MTTNAFHGDGRSAWQDPLFPAGTPLAMAYVPMQTLVNIYEPANALMRGTLFPELDKPWLPKEGGASK